MREPLAYREDRYLPQSAAGLSLHDTGFVQGVTVTDLVRTFQRQLFRWPEHLARFRQSCQLARAPLHETDANLEIVARELLTANGRLLDLDQELGLVLFATPGPIGWYLGDTDDGRPTFGMHTFPLPFARYRRLITTGATLLFPGVHQMPASTIDRRIKQRSRLVWWLAEQEVRVRDARASALMLDADGSVTETAFANFLLVRQGQVLSPPAEQILGGISLGVVREFCFTLGIPFEERRLTADDCFAADEALLTCTSFCLAPVAQIEQHHFPSERPIFERLLAAWSSQVGLDIRRQILGP